jgi:hypothetical protein
MRFFVGPVAGITLLVAIIAVVASSLTALAQSGNAGGSIGNDDKSLSGPRETPRSVEPERRARRSEREEPRRASRGGGGGANRFDGSWSYVAVGTNCQGTGSGAGIIANGRAIGPGTTGGVSPSGAYHAVTVGNDGIVTTANGHISGNSASGTYTQSNGCTGRWSSTRQ